MCKSEYRFLFLTREDYHSFRVANREGVVYIRSNLSLLYFTLISFFSHARQLLIQQQSGAKNASAYLIYKMRGEDILVIYTSSLAAGTGCLC